MKFTITGEFTSLNPYIDAERSNRFMAAKLKKRETEFVRLATLSVPPIDRYPVHIVFNWYVPKTRCDPDNIAFAKKFILDGLQDSGVIENDDWKHVAGGFEDNFYVDADNPRVEIEITEAQ